MGCVGGDNRLTYDESLDIEEQSVTSFTQQFASSYLNNVALPDGRRLWSSVVINNPNPTEATVTLTIRSNNGLEITPALTKKIPPDTYYNSYGQPDWRAPAAGSIGWVELTSNVPVVATNQITLRNGMAYDSPVSLSNDEPFLKSTSTRLLSTFFLRNWPAGATNLTQATVTQWTDIIVNNPNLSAADITVRVYKSDGKSNGSLHALQTAVSTQPRRGDCQTSGASTSRTNAGHHGSWSAGSERASAPASAARSSRARVRSKASRGATASARRS